MKSSHHRNTPLARAVRSALTYGILGLGVLPLMAQGQSNEAVSGSASSSQAQNLGKIQVIGSRIKRSNVETARPVLRIDRAEIEATGVVNVGQLLQQVTSSGSALNSRIDVGGSGATNVDLRNLGANRVLVLVNGKRWITSLSGSVDLDTIPTSIVQSIQILKDGAAAVYGSDAIAGVINIITIKDFNGAQASAYIGEYNYGGDWDGQTQQYYYTMGYGNDKGNITFNVEYRQNDAVPDSARPISSVPYYGTPIGSSVGPQGRFQFYPPSDSSLYGNAALCPPNQTGQPFCDLTVKSGAPGTSISDFRPWNGATDAFNYASLYDLIAPNNATNLYLQGSYALTDNITFHSTVMYDNHTSVQSYSPYPLGFSAGGLPDVISKDNPYNPFGFDLNPNIDAPQPGAAQLIQLGRRPLEAGYRDFTETTDTYYYNGGFDGSLIVGSRELDWNANYIYGHVLEADLTPTGEFNTARLTYALGPAAACQTQPGCVPLNLFGGQYNGGTITPEMLKYVQTSEQAQTSETLRDYEVNLSSADILDLPAGGLGFNVGYEYRQIGGSNHPDTIQQAGLSTDGFAASTGGEYHVNSIYGELDIPLLANLIAVKNLDIDLATRSSRYSTFGSNNTSQVGLRWQPNSELLIRATWGQGFRGPNVAELYRGLSSGFPFLTDPCNATNLPTESAQTVANCRAAGVPATYNQLQGEIQDESGGNPNVQPETSLSRTVGFVYNPSALPGFDFNADYYRIQISNLISTFGAQGILNGCYIAGVSQFCDLVQRNQSGIITQLRNVETNVGSILTEGIDVGLNYTFNTSIGHFKATLESTFTKEYEQTIPSSTGGSPTVYHLAGWERGDVYEGYPRNKSILSLNWTSGSWSATGRVRYISGLREDCTGFTSYGVCSDPNKDHASYAGGAIPTNYLGATTYVDAQAKYDFMGANVAVSFGINNLFNREPPVSYTAHNLSFDPTLYDIPGRLFYLRVTTRF